MPAHKTLLVVVQDVNPLLLKYTTAHAYAMAEEVALRGVVARVVAEPNPFAQPLTVARWHARTPPPATRPDGVMLLRADYPNRDMYDTVGASDLWRSTHGTATILSYTEGGPTRENGYLYLAPTVALAGDEWTLPGVSPVWAAISPGCAERGARGVA